ncbi:MAG: DUF1786 domain-containing protein [Candidatus Bathyarchaeota archaeon]|nr:MAG: DUF1786 domain-containing protein [Candidatus Bathyarchaeota archaeon]
MKILALDIGAGTEDVLLYDEEKRSIENCVKMVLPSPSLVFAKKVEAATNRCRSVLVEGSPIGGGAFAHALKKHIEAGLDVYMTERSAYTIRNSLKEVRELGFKIVQGESSLERIPLETIRIKEINIEALERLLAEFGESLSNTDVVAVAVQDHGASPPGISNRRFRIQNMEKLLRKNPYPEYLSFEGSRIPKWFRRMNSAAQAVKNQLPHAKVLVMDTAPAAILGCLKDPTIQKIKSALVLNVGNCHTMATLISEGKISALMEHHTRRLSPSMMQQLLGRFTEGELTDEQVFQSGGHGSFYLADALSAQETEVVVATGPNRNILTDTNLGAHFAAPAGDVMMTGTMGLVEAVKRRFA